MLFKHHRATSYIPSGDTYCHMKTILNIDHNVGATVIGPQPMPRTPEPRRSGACAGISSSSQDFPSGFLEQEIVALFRELRHGA